MPPQSILNRNKDLGNYDKYLPMRDCFCWAFDKWTYKGEILCNFAFCVGQITMAEAFFKWGGGQKTMNGFLSPTTNI